MPDYLSNVNPAGTVPVLVHNGHPVYESHEQILYIDRSGSYTILESDIPFWYMLYHNSVIPFWNRETKCHHMALIKT